MVSSLQMITQLCASQLVHACYMPQETIFLEAYTKTFDRTKLYYFTYCLALHYYLRKLW
jgi:hypothetical protein